MNIYVVTIVDNKNKIIDELEVEAESLEEAERIGFEEWIEGLKDRHYAVASME